MFTGIVEELGVVNGLEVTEAGGRLSVRVPNFASELEIGESLANNGCCLTVTRVDGDVVSFDILQETLRMTNLGTLQEGSLVNLERALRVGDRLSGHFVQGHVDGTAEVRAVESDGNDYRLEISLPEAFSQYTISKGSITVNGISLTIARLERVFFELWITPHTFEVTNLKAMKAGDIVNLEFDMLAKYMERFARR